MDRISLRDVAAAAGVSVTTASHVLSDAPGKRVSAATRERVRQEAQRLGYRPNSLARGLRLQRSHTIALISDEIATTPFAGRLVLGAQEAAAKRGWMLFLVNTGFDAALEDREIGALRERQVDGFLYGTMYHREISVPAALRDVPLVLLDARTADPTVSSVVPDEVGGGRTATEVLLAAGHRRIGFITNVDDIPATGGRHAGYAAALADAGVRLDPDLVVAHDSTAAGGRAAAERLLTRTDRPTAVFCFNDRMAMGAYQAAAQLGLRIPEDLSVVGFDDLDLITDSLLPGLTSVALPHYEMGAWAADALLGPIDGPPSPPVQHVMPCPVVTRRSVAPPA